MFLAFVRDNLLAVYRAINVGECYAREIRNENFTNGSPMT